MTDPVHEPAHYTQGAVECIDAIEAALGRDGFIAFLRGQVIKYQWRCGLKDAAAQDAAKAHWYSERLVAALAESPATMHAEALERAEGWVHWTGGPQPVVGTVQVRYRDPTYPDLAPSLGPASRFTWLHSRTAGDIVAYRSAA